MKNKTIALNSIEKQFVKDANSQKLLVEFSNETNIKNKRYVSRSENSNYYYEILSSNLGLGLVLMDKKKNETV